jgi:rhodanese-related sulfurtransferase
VIALFPQQAAESTAFLQGGGVAVSDVRQVQLGAIGIHLTPTLVMTDQKGTITNLWLGQLTASQATEVWRILKGGKVLSSGSEFVPARIVAADLDRLRAEGKEIEIVDIRSRNDYAKDARAGTVNIPFDELAVRAGIELSKHRLTVISCRATPPVFCDFAAKNLTQSGFPEVAVLVDTPAK